MAHIPSEGKGILSRNQKKASPNSPDWKGQIRINGEDVKLAAWEKDVGYGPFLTLAVDNWKPQNANTQQYPKEVPPPDAGDVPF
jgi:hypothetical protein